jgi:group I intron endonuclease
VKKCGIYIIENIKNNKIYIGQSTDIQTRFYVHKSLLKHNSHPNHHLQSAWNKYGETFFKFAILEILSEYSFEKLNEKEIYYINLYKSNVFGYNITNGGKNFSLKKTNPSDEDRIKKIYRDNGIKLANRKSNSKNLCLICGKETDSGWNKYCNSHKYKCLKCGKRSETPKRCFNCKKVKIPKPEKEKILACVLCGKIIEKTNNNQKYCGGCTKIVRRDKQKRLMRARRDLLGF